MNFSEPQNRKGFDLKELFCGLLKPKFSQRVTMCAQESFQIKAVTSTYLNLD